MRNLLLIVLSVCLWSVAIARPALYHTKEREAADYDNEIEGDDPIEEDEDSRADGQDSAADEQDEERQSRQQVRAVNGDAYAQRTADNHAAELANHNYRSSQSGRNFALEEEADKQSEYQSPGAPRDIKRLTARYENAQQLEPIGYVLAPEFDKLRAQKNVLDTRNRGDMNNAGGDILFENSQHNQEQYRRDYKAAELQEMRYPRRDSNAEVKVLRDRSENPVYSNRERRALQNDNQTISNANPPGDSENVPDEDEETAIKRHVKKLSAEELNKFMSSLSDDKRELLKKIINSDDNAEVNKREITKKTSAVDDNSLLDSGSERPDSSKLEKLESDVTTEVSAPEVSVAGKESKPLESGNSSSNSIDNNLDQADVTTKSPDLNSEAKLVPSAEQVSKTKSKRDVSTELESTKEDPQLEEDLSAKDIQDLPNESGHYCQGKEMVDDDPQSDNYSNMLKREVHDDNELKNSIKSLEESFPNSNSYEDDDPYSGSDMAPLVRVKRNNINMAMKKRAAGILPEARVGFYPYRAENDDEDNDEGNEFDNDGFYDSGLNLANGKDKTLEDSLAQAKTESEIYQPNNINTEKLSEPLNSQNDKARIGSDSDNVVTGVEGADENLMFDSASRNKRTVDESGSVQHAGVNQNTNQNRLARSTPLPEDDVNMKPDNNVPLYNPNDAFGPLSRTYENGRYKRIRRVKQQPSFDESEASSSN